MKKALIAALAATSIIAGIGAAQADGSDLKATQLFRDRGANIVTPEDPRAPVPYVTQSQRRPFMQPANGVMSPRYGDSLTR